MWALFFSITEYLNSNSRWDFLILFRDYFTAVEQYGSVNWMDRGYQGDPKFFTVTVKWYVVKHKRNKLTFLATLLAWAMSSLILRMLVVTLFTGFFSSTTFSLSSSSGTSTFRFSTAGQIQEHEQKLAFFLNYFIVFTTFTQKQKLFTCFPGRCNSIFERSSRVLVVSHVMSPLLHFVVDGSDGLKHPCWVVQSLFCHFQGKVQTLRGSVWKWLQIDEKQKNRELNSVSEYFSLMKEDYWRLKTDSDILNNSMTIWNTEKRQFSFVHCFLLKGQICIFEAYGGIL